MNIAGKMLARGIIIQDAIELTGLTVEAIQNLIARFHKALKKFGNQIEALDAFMKLTMACLTINNKSEEVGMSLRPNSPGIFSNLYNMEFFYEKQY